MNGEETASLRLTFWEGLLTKFNERTNLFLGVSPSKDPWLAKAVSKGDVGVGGIVYEFVMSFRPPETRVQLKIDVPDRDKAKNKEIFDIFYEDYEGIEKDFGDILCWLRRDKHIYSRIAYIVTKNGVKNVTHWNDIQNKMVTSMIKLEQALSKHYGKIKILFE